MTEKYEYCSTVPRTFVQDCSLLYVAQISGRACRTLDHSAGLSKLAGCWRKSPPTWLVSTGYSAWHFITDGVF